MMDQECGVCGAIPGNDHQHMRADWYSHEGATAQDVVNNTGETRIQLECECRNPIFVPEGSRLADGHYPWCKRHMSKDIFLSEQQEKCLRGEHKAIDHEAITDIDAEYNPTALLGVTESESDNDTIVFAIYEGKNSRKQFGVAMCKHCRCLFVEPK